MKKTLLLFIVCASIISIAQAQWQQTSLDSEQINCITVTGNNIFVGASNGVYFSSNNGSNWAFVNTGLPANNAFVEALAISGNNIFAGTKSDGVYLSTNNGSSWTAVNTGLTGYALVVQTLAIKGSNIFAGTQDGVYLSSNNGNSWSAVNTGLTATNIRAFAISGSNIFAGTNSSSSINSDSVYLSSNNGNSWIPVNTGLLTNGYIFTLAISGNNIFAGTYNYGNGDGGVYLSTNNGGNWDAMNTGLTNLNVYSLAISGSSIFAGTQGGGVFLSSNNGSIWTNVGLGGDGISALAVCNGYIFAGVGNNEGVWKTSLTGLGIEEINNESVITIYPNPAMNNITIESPQNAIIEITNMQDQLIKTIAASSNKTNVDVSALSSGVYVVKVKTEKGIAVKKFIKE